MAEQDWKDLPLLCRCAGSRERSSQGQGKEKGPGNCPCPFAHRGFIPEQGLSSIPTQAVLGGVNSPL